MGGKVIFCLGLAAVTRANDLHVRGSASKVSDANSSTSPNVSTSLNAGNRTSASISVIASENAASALSRSSDFYYYYYDPDAGIPPLKPPLMPEFQCSSMGSHCKTVCTGCGRFQYSKQNGAEKCNCRDQTNPDDSAPPNSSAPHAPQKPSQMPESQWSSMGSHCKTVLAGCGTYQYSKQNGAEKCNCRDQTTAGLLSFACPAGFPMWAIFASLVRLLVLLESRGWML